MLASVAFHLLLFVGWRVTPVSPHPGHPAAAGPVPSPAIGAGGLMAVNVARPERIEVPPPPAPRLVPDAPAVERLELESVGVSPSLTPVVLAGAPGSGDASAAGSGSGESSGGEGGDSFTAPIPRSLVPHWDPPDEVRGMKVTVRVRVDERGKATGEVELLPPTPNEKFNRQLREKATRMAYYPARRRGRPVPGWAEITFVF